MSSERPTLKDIANTLGVSTTTVHRALQGKEGVSDETGAEIRRLAAEMGYRANYMASALKRRVLRLAIVFPEPSQENQYYYRSLWQGARQFFQENREFFVEPVEFPYPLAPGAHGAVLKELYLDHLDGLDGLLTLAVDHGQSAYFLEKLSHHGVPIALVGADLYRDLRLCCVKAQDELAGTLAAELLYSFRPGPFQDEVILTGNPVGSFSMVDQARNVSGFEAAFRTHAPGARLLTAYDPDVERSGRDLRRLLTDHPDVCAVYSVSARHTVMACQVLADLGLSGRVKLIGNDRFPESVAALKAGVLTAVIDKKVPQQSFRAARLLFDYVLKGEAPPPAAVSVRPTILLRGNAEA